jgi:hypothetical protein
MATLIFMAYLISCCTALAFLTNVGEKHNCVSPGAVQVKNRRETMGFEEKLDVINQLEKVNKLLTCTVMLDGLIVMYV